MGDNVITTHHNNHCVTNVNSKMSYFGNTEMHKNTAKDDKTDNHSVTTENYSLEVGKKDILDASIGTDNKNIIGQNSAILKTQAMNNTRKISKDRVKIILFILISMLIIGINITTDILSPHNTITSYLQPSFISLAVLLVCAGLLFITTNREE